MVARQKKLKKAKKKCSNEQTLTKGLKTSSTLGLLTYLVSGNRDFSFLILIGLSDCAHLFLCEEFLPKTGLLIRHSLSDNGRSTEGFRSKASSFELTWTILDLHRTPPTDRCCYKCNPELVIPFAPADKHDPRLVAFSHHFRYGLAPPVSRPGSSASVQTNTLTVSSFTPVRRPVKAPDEQQEKLRERLLVWRNEKHPERGSPIFLSAQVILPPKQLDAFVDLAARFLQEQTLTTQLIRKLVPWDSATESDLEEVLSIISDWRDTAAIVIPSTPTSQRRARKKKRADLPNNLATVRQTRPVIQPNFAPQLTPLARSTQPITQPSFTSRFRLPASPHPIQALNRHTNHFVNENVFQTPHPPTPRAMPGPSSYAAAVSSKPAPSTLHAPNFSMHAPLHPYSPFASSGLSWTPAPSTPVQKRPLIQ